MPDIRTLGLPITALNPARRGTALLPLPVAFYGRLLAWNRTLPTPTKQSNPGYPREKGP